MQVEITHEELGLLNLIRCIDPTTYPRLLTLLTAYIEAFPADDPNIIFSDSDS